MPLSLLPLLAAAIVWGVVHSLLASHTFKAWVRRLAGEKAYNRFYRFAYNLFAAASLLPLLAMLLTLPDSHLYTIPEPWVYLSVLIQGGAVFVLIGGVIQTGVFEFAGLTQLSGLEEKPEMVTDGYYAYVRHPLYTASLALLWAMPTMTVNSLTLWVIFSLYLVIGAYFEEKKLLKDFGDAYAQYRARTPFLLPRIGRR
jgi:protein-S-isoprenylcysteine O-methyltransferase Ste14